MASVRWSSFSVLALAAVGFGAGCRHAETAAPTRLPAQPVVRVEAHDRELTVVESQPPVKPDLDAPSAPTLPPLEVAPGIEVDVADNDAPVPPGRLVGVAQLDPQRNETMRGMATVVDDLRGPTMVISVQMAVAGRYEVLLLDAARRCNERDSARGRATFRRQPAPVGPSVARLGTIEVNDKGAGSITISLPQPLVRSGLGALQNRPVVISESGDRPINEKHALSCGPLRFGPDEAPAI